ncbi:MAG: branched-chain amino acid transport system ATP-binding protein [Desulforhopalus sp.]|jgi:branched-chain amino acid transport system ATP-binding protein
MLTLKDISTFYGDSQALYGVSLKVREGQVVTLLGRNGMGKSTTIRSIMGLTPAAAGSINFVGENITEKPSYYIARKGIGLVPEGRQIFPNLTVKENLFMAQANHRNVKTPYTLGDILTIFPRLKERLTNYGNQLSGGEQQMLAIGRALMINPRLVILDEATEGLAPLVRKEIWRGLNVLKDKGLAILIVDKNLGALMSIAQYHYILENGRVAWEGSTKELQDQPEMQNRFLGV